MIELSDRQRLPGTARSFSIASFFGGIRENANSLHETLKSGWNCYCNSSHKSMLQLERRANSGDSSFNLFFLLEGMISGSDGTPPTDSQPDAPRSRAGYMEEQASCSAEDNHSQAESWLTHVCVTVSKRELNKCLEMPSSTRTTNITQGGDSSSLNSTSVSRPPSTVTSFVNSNCSRKDIQPHQTARNVIFQALAPIDLRLSFR